MALLYVCGTFACNRPRQGNFFPPDTIPQRRNYSRVWDSAYYFAYVGRDGHCYEETRWAEYFSSQLHRPNCVMSRQVWNKRTVRMTWNEYRDETRQHIRKPACTVDLDKRFQANLAASIKQDLHHGCKYCTCRHSITERPETVQIIWEEECCSIQKSKIQFHINGKIILT